MELVEKMGKLRENLSKWTALLNGYRSWLQANPAASDNTINTRIETLEKDIVAVLKRIAQIEAKQGQNNVTTLVEKEGASPSQIVLSADRRAEITAALQQAEIFLQNLSTTYSITL